MTPRPTLVILGQVVVAAHPDRIETAEAVAIAGDRVVASGRRDEVLDGARDARVIDAGDAAVVPGLHDFHLHLVGMARARRGVQLADVASYDELVGRVAAGAAALPSGAWVMGRGWPEASLDQSDLDRLEAAVGDRPALLTAHDGHSLWASSAALRMARVAADAPEPAGGRFERDQRGRVNGVLRERAMDAVQAVAVQLSGADLGEPLDEQVTELAAYGITGATDAGDYNADNGIGRYAALGDSFSNLAEAVIDGRLRLTIDLPWQAIGAARTLGLHTTAVLDATRRVGWAKLHADGALGSRTAALFEPYTCGAGDRGILRVTPDELDRLLADATSSDIALAVHAIGDRALAEVLDAFERAGTRPAGLALHRIEHVQLARPTDRERFAALDITASLQPLHCPSDVPTLEACWADRTQLAYPWRSLADAGARLAFGSDAPIEPPDPWLGMFAAVHRRYPHQTDDWHADQALPFSAALSAYTLGPARAFGRDDEGHLRPNAVADLAVLDADLPTLLAADERLAAVRSVLTLVGGRETYRS